MPAPAGSLRPARCCGPSRAGGARCSDRSPRARPTPAPAPTCSVTPSPRGSADVLVKQLAPAGVVLDAVACRGTIYSCVTPGLRTQPPAQLATIPGPPSRLAPARDLVLRFNDRPLAGAIDRVMESCAARGAPGRVGQPERAPKRDRATNRPSARGARPLARAAILDCGPSAPGARPGSSTGAPHGVREGGVRAASWRRRSATSREDEPDRAAASGRAGVRRGAAAADLSYDRRMRLKSRQQRTSSSPPRQYWVSRGVRPARPTCPT